MTIARMIARKRAYVLPAAWLIIVITAGSSFRAQEPLPAMAVYKTAACGCCVKWIDLMRAQGFAVKTVDVENIGDVKRTWGVPTGLAACHTAVVAGYVVEGHVPVEAVTRLLRERPQVTGIAVPGMPLGSPGMEQPTGRVEPYSVLSFDRSGKTAIYDRR